MTRGPWRIAGGSLSLDRPIVMGVLNVTPDSFSDGGELRGVDDALGRAEVMVEEGAAVLDVGGESTRPGAGAVDESEEIRRVVPVIEALVARLPIPISVDTRKSGVAREAIGAGAAIVNDVSALSFDARMPSVVASAGVGAVLMHMRGTPADMRDRASYECVEREVADELGSAVAHAVDAGIRPESIVLDPGIGFAKSARDSVRLLARLGPLLELGYPVLVGPSRKSFLGEILSVPPRERAVGTASACVLAFIGGARIFRVHDVAVTVQALQVAAAIEGERLSSAEVEITK